jgi:small subunit ribosomal protein S1
LIYISDYLGKENQTPSEFVNVGEKVDVVVLELDVDGRKLSLGHKQTTLILGINTKDHAVGTVHTGEIAEIVDKGATVEFGETSLLLFVTLKEDGRN